MRKRSKKKEGEKEKKLTRMILLKSVKEKLISMTLQKNIPLITQLLLDLRKLKKIQRKEKIKLKKCSN